jgi:hypothetical protein
VGRDGEVYNSDFQNCEAKYFYIRGLTNFRKSEVICPGFAKATPGAAVVLNLSQIANRHCEERQ